MPDCDLDRSVAFCFYNKREKPNTLVSVFSGEVHLRNVLRVWWRIVSATARLTFVTAGYGWLTTIAPILAAAPGYFGGNLTFGELMMVAAAFSQVQTSLRWFIDNFGVIADWRATLLRIADFRAALIGYPPLPDGKKALEF